MSWLILVPLVVIVVCFILRVPIAFALFGGAISYMIASGGNLTTITDIVMGNHKC